VPPDAGRFHAEDFAKKDNLTEEGFYEDVERGMALEFGEE
jgi:hypothetical protein